uniref:sensor histidine kinase n=1 Tax=Candidatus Electronema sp. TaxID=2698783 RepID=UPI004055A879
MHSYFASPERTDQETLAAELDFAGRNPVISGLLSSVGGLLAVLDEHRQIVALNDGFLQMLDIEDPASILGLRPGEALGCIHAHEEPGGCGTSKFCSSCGAAIAIVSSLTQNEPAERICALSAVRKDGRETDAALLVRSRPLLIEGRRFLLLFVQDVTKEQRRAALERAFFHDINSMLGLLAGAAELMAEENRSPLTETVRRTSMRLSKEVAVHRYLLQDQAAVCEPTWSELPAAEILDELRSFSAIYAAAYQKEIVFSEQVPPVSVRTDLSLLLRVVCNMITNALEASEEGGVRVWLEEHEDSRLSFCVWNGQEIPPETARRIFQLHFSTKSGTGRGIGTYSMKLIGEKLLGGSVSFSSSASEGTVFRFTVPVRKAWPSKG